MSESYNPKLNIWRMVPLLVVIFACARASAGAGPSLTEVHVALPENLKLPNAHVLIYAVPTDKDDWPTIQADIVRTAESEVSASLPPGKYVAEVGAVDAAKVTLLQSPPFIVPDTKRITLRAEKHSCSATILRKPARIQQVAIRRLGSGDVRWKFKDSPPPVVITSPAQSYVTSCIADLDQRYLAIWSPKEPIKTSKLSFSDENANHRLSFSFRAGTPALASSQMTLYFPDTSFTVDDLTRAVVVSNRDRAYFSYHFVTAAKEKLCFVGGAYQFKHQIKLELGGPLTPRMFAGFIASENGGGWDPGGLDTRIDLADAGGMLFEGNESRPVFRVQLLFAPDNQAPVPLEGHKPGPTGFKPESILARVEYDYGGRVVKTECRGENLVRVQSEHFSIATPSQWMFRARQFLSCLEAVRLVTIKNTGRPGPSSFHIDWRRNGDSAKSIVGSQSGGEQNIWMSFPWWTFDAFWDPFTEPWFGNNDPYICHEILHTFGYHHGDEMSRLEWKAEDQYRTFRWRAVDSGIWPVGQIRLRGEKL